MAKTRNSNNLRGQESLNQQAFIPDTQAKAVTDSILAPGIVVTTNTSTTAVLVKQNSIIRVKNSTLAYIAFGGGSMTAPTSSTSPGFELPANTYVLLNATADFMMSSAALDRIEILHQEQ